MANFTAYSAFNLGDLDLNTLITNGNGSAFDGALPRTLGGTTYADIVGYQYLGAGYRTAYFAGSGFAITAQGVPTAGTVTALGEFNGKLGDFSAPHFVLQGISVSLTALASAAFTTGTADDMALVRTMFAKADVITLSDGDDVMSGFGGADRIYGGNGDDWLYGGAGNDKLFGGTGQNYLDGGTGNDLLDGGPGGADIAGYYDATKAVHVDLALTGAQDTIGAGKDRLVHIEGIDGSKFADILSGDKNNNLLFGEGGVDTLDGRAGNDYLFGGHGHDVLTGGKGSDIFVFQGWENDTYIPLTSADSDVITDFSHAQHDLIALSHLDFSHFAETPGLPVSATEFYAATTDTAHAATDRLIYNTKTGALWYDADGNGAGAAILIATLGTTTHPTLTASDIYIYA